MSILINNLQIKQVKAQTKMSECSPPHKKLKHASDPTETALKPKTNMSESLLPHKQLKHASDPAETALSILEKLPCDAKVETALSILEKVPCDARVKAALTILENSKNASYDVTWPHTARMMEIVKHTQEVISKKVFADEHLLSIIFGFEGSLTYFVKNSSEMIGWTDFQPSPSSTEFHLSDNDPRQLNRQPNHSRMMVCKRWFRFLAGSFAIKAAEKEIRSAHQKELDAARIAKDDEDLPWVVRFFAMAMVDDIEQSSEMLPSHSLPSTEIRNSIQSFLTNSSSLIAEIDSSHPFKEIFLSLWEQTSKGRDNDSTVLDFPKRCAVVAAIYGSTQVLGFYQGDIPGLWSNLLGREGTTDRFSRRRMVIMDLVARVCSQPLLATETKILDGIRQLLQDDFHPVQDDDAGRILRTEYFSGPLLHFAAASGCLELVQLLVETGIPISFPCNGRTALDWVNVRRWTNTAIGHVEVFDKYGSVFDYLMENQEMLGSSDDSDDDSDHDPDDPDGDPDGDSDDFSIDDFSIHVDDFLTRQFDLEEGNEDVDELVDSDNGDSDDFSTFLRDRRAVYHPNGKVAAVKRLRLSRLFSRDEDGDEDGDEEEEGDVRSLANINDEEDVRDEVGDEEGNDKSEDKEDGKKEGERGRKHKEEDNEEEHGKKDGDRGRNPKEPGSDGEFEFDDDYDRSSSHRGNTEDCVIS